MPKQPCESARSSIARQVVWSRTRPVVRPGLILGVSFFGVAVLSGLGGIALLLGVLVPALILNYLIAAQSVNTASLSAILPPSGTVGEQMIWSVMVRGNQRGFLFVGADSHQRVPAIAQKTADVPVVLDRRGIYSVARLRVVSPGPLSLPLHAARFLNIDLVVPICVAPKRIPNPELLSSVISVSHSDGELAHRGTSLGEPHHLREYFPGDSARMVHWPATARTGSIMVREPERTGGVPTTTVLVDFLDGSDRGEKMLSEAAWLCDRLIERGVSLQLITSEGGQPDTARIDRVGSVSDLEVVLASADILYVHIQDRSPMISVVNGMWCIDGKMLSVAGADQHDS